MVNNSSLFHRQIIAHPSEIRKQTNDLLTGGQCRGEELTKTEREVQGCDEKRHHSRINESTTENQIKQKQKSVKRNVSGLLLARH